VEAKTPGVAGATGAGAAAATSVLRYLAMAMEFRCPICRTPVSSETAPEFPFCSERCRVQDLANWATEKYVVSEPAAMDEESAPTRDDQFEVPFRPTRNESKN